MPFRIPDVEEYDENATWPTTFGGDFCGDHCPINGPPIYRGS
jgi:hypothetical protein